MRFSLLLSLLATACFGQTVYKNAGTKLGTAVFVDCSADAGVNCTRTAATGTVNVRCSTGSTTELGCVSTTTQSFAGDKTIQGTLRAQEFGGADGGPVRAYEYASADGGPVRAYSYGGADAGPANFPDGFSTGLSGTGVAFASFPAASAGNVGRMLYDSTNKALRVSNGTYWHIMRSDAAPTISSGFGTAPAIEGVASSFQLTVGTPNASTTGNVALNATAPIRFGCTCTNISSPTTLKCMVCGHNQSSVDLCSWSLANPAVATAFTAGDLLIVQCTAY